MFRTLIALTASVLILVVVGVLVSAQTVTFEECSSPLCTSSSCHKQQFNSGECLRIEGRSNESVSMTCSNATMACVPAALYSDDKCTQRESLISSACNSCQRQFNGNGSFLISCGAIYGGQFVVMCTDDACMNCQPQLILNRKCTLLKAVNKHILIAPESACNGDSINFNWYKNSSKCEGTPLPSVYWNDHCNEGRKLSCSNEQSMSQQQQKQQKTIKIDFDKVMPLN